MMRKIEMVEALAGKLGTTRRAAEEALTAVVEILEDGINSSGAASLPNFGVFSKKVRSARTARNPKTGEKILVGPRATVAFRPASRLKAKQ